MSDLDLLKVATKVKRARNKNKGRRNLDLLKECLIKKVPWQKVKNGNREIKVNP